MTSHPIAPEEHRRLRRNLPLFIAFRVAFNARWYYPVMGVLFLDLGVTLEQFALLNVAWAMASVVLEVPSGAVADLMGRRRIVILAAACMVVEMVLLAFAPSGTAWLFPVLLLNRILSGTAEACASGADESLAYDSLRVEGREGEWPAVLARLGRWQSGAFFVTMLLGAAVYDTNTVHRAVAAVGLESVARLIGSTMRWPLYLTLVNAVAALVFTLGLREPPLVTQPGGATLLPDSAPASPVRAAFAQTFATGSWILRSPVVLFVILAGLSFDSVIRLFLTLSSNFFRLIGLQEAWFGVFGSAMALLGFVAAWLSQRLVQRCSMAMNFAIVGGLTVLGLALAAPAWHGWSLVAMVPLDLAMAMVGFFLSHYLHGLVSDSRQRSTVLSFKGLALNLAYGGIGLLFAGYSAMRRHAGMEEVAVLPEALRWLPVYAAVVCGGVAWMGRRLLRRGEVAGRPAE